MARIVRLQGLDVKAGSEDIRTFFKSLHIPDGGVYIVGGHLGEAYIAFSSESDAQTAVQRNGNFLKGSMVTLQVSSMEEMEQKLEESLKKQTIMLNIGKPKPCTAVNETSRPHMDTKGNGRSRSRPHGVTKTKVKLKFSLHDVTMAKENPESKPHDVTMAKVKPKSKLHDAKVKPKSKPHDVTMAKENPESKPHDDTMAKVKPKSKPHDAKENPESKPHDVTMAKEKPESKPHHANMAKVKPKSKPHDAKVKPKSKPHGAKVKPKSKPHGVAKTIVKPESTSNDNIAMVKPESRLHIDGTSVSSAAFPINPGAADLSATNTRHFQLSPRNKPVTNPQPLDTGTAFILGICSVLQRLKSTGTIVPTFEFPKDDSTTLSESVRNPEHTSDLRPGYVRLFGLPTSATKQDICRFFKALHVQEVIVNVELGIGRGCLVKFADIKDAADALGFNQQMLGSICVEVRGADEKMWKRALQECRKAFDGWSKDKHGGSSKERSHHERKHVSALQIKRKSDHQVQMLKRKKPNAEPNVSISNNSEYIIMVRNLPRNITKTEIKQLFKCPNIPHKNVLHLLDKTRSVTDTAFVIFNCAEDFDYALNLSGCHVCSCAIEVTSITKEIMRKIMAENRPRNQRIGPTDPRLQSRPRKSDPVQTERENPNMIQRYIFVRNLPVNVKKSQIRSLFCKFNLCLDDIMILCDGKGYGTGEAVVKFESEQQATLAQNLHGKEFLGTNVLLTLINTKQVQKVLMNS